MTVAELMNFFGGRDHFLLFASTVKICISNDNAVKEQFKYYGIDKDQLLTDQSAIPKEVNNTGFDASAFFKTYKKNALQNNILHIPFMDINDPKDFWDAAKIGTAQYFPSWFSSWIDKISQKQDAIIFLCQSLIEGVIMQFIQIAKDTYQEGSLGDNLLEEYKEYMNFELLYELQNGSPALNNTKVDEALKLTNIENFLSFLDKKHKEVSKQEEEVQEQENFFISLCRQKIQKADPIKIVIGGKGLLGSTLAMIASGEIKNLPPCMKEFMESHYITENVPTVIFDPWECAMQYANNIKNLDHNNLHIILNDLDNNAESGRIGNTIPFKEIASCEEPELPPAVGMSSSDRLSKLHISSALHPGTRTISPNYEELSSFSNLIYDSYNGNSLKIEGHTMTAYDVMGEEAADLNITSVYTHDGKSYLIAPGVDDVGDMLSVLKIIVSNMASLEHHPVVQQYFKSLNSVIDWATKGVQLAKNLSISQLSGVFSALLSSLSQSADEKIENISEEAKDFITELAKGAISGQMLNYLFFMRHSMLTHYLMLLAEKISEEFEKDNKVCDQENVSQFLEGKYKDATKEAKSLLNNENGEAKEYPTTMEEYLKQSEKLSEFFKHEPLSELISQEYFPGNAGKKDEICNLLGSLKVDGNGLDTTWVGHGLGGTVVQLFFALVESGKGPCLKNIRDDLEIKSHLFSPMDFCYQIAKTCGISAEELGKLGGSTMHSYSLAPNYLGGNFGDLFSLFSGVDPKERAALCKKIVDEAPDLGYFMSAISKFFDAFDRTKRSL